MSPSNQSSSRRNGSDSEKDRSKSGENQRREVHQAAPRFSADPSTAPERQRPEGRLPDFAHLAAHYPVTTLLAGFSAGFGLGVLATVLFSQEEESWSDRYALKGSLREVTSSLQRVPDLLTRLANQLPDSLSNRW